MANKAALLSYVDLMLAREYPSSDAEVDDLRVALETVRELASRDLRYLLAAVRASESYLGFGAAFVTGVVDIVQPWGTRQARVVAVPAEHAQWQRDRLLSGLCTESQTIFPTFEAALAGDTLP